MEDHLKICRECKASCCKIGGTDFTEAEKSRVIDAGHPDHFIKISEDHYETRCSDGICPYLGKTDECTIHDLRPSLCRRWPIYSTVDNDRKETFLVNCPLAKILKENHIEEMRCIDGCIPEGFIKDSIEKSRIPIEDQEKISERFSSFSLTPV